MVPVARFADGAGAHPPLIERLFTAAERFNAHGVPRTAGVAGRPVRGQGGVAKALGAPGGMSWNDAEVMVDDSGRPSLIVVGHRRRAGPPSSASAAGTCRCRTTAASPPRSSSRRAERCRASGRSRRSAAAERRGARRPAGRRPDAARAARAVAVECARHARLRLRRPGGAAGRAPATTAATRCTPARSWPGAGRAVSAVLARPGPGARRRAGRVPRRRRPVRRRWPTPAAADLVRRRHPRHRRPAGRCVRTLVPLVRWTYARGRRRCWPSTSPPGWTRHRRGDRAGGARQRHGAPSARSRPACWSATGRLHAGRLRLVDIGLGPGCPSPRLYRLERRDLAAPLPGPAADDKYTRGVVGVAAGSRGLSRARRCCASARPGSAGSGMVRYAGHAAAEVVRPLAGGDRAPTRVAEAGRVQAWVVGPGPGRHRRGGRAARAACWPATCRCWSTPTG